MTRNALYLLLLAALVAAIGCEHATPEYSNSTSAPAAYSSTTPAPAAYASTTPAPRAYSNTASAPEAASVTDPRFTSTIPFTDLTPSKPPPPMGGMKEVKLNNRIDPKWLQPPTDLFTLGPGDRVELEVLGEPVSRATTVVAPDGKLYFNLLPGIDVWGLTLAEAKARIEQELGKYVREPAQISMVLRAIESKRIWILGRVQVPGVYTMAAPMTVLEAISLAGGTLSLTSYQDQEAAGMNEELADLHRTFIIRRGNLLPVDFYRLLNKGDLSQNIYLQPDDFIYFPGATAREVYVLGAVTQPRFVSYRRGLTAAAAIASAYGTLTGAYLSHVAVVRGALQNPQIAIIDYKAIIKGKTNDLALEPGDIVYVPFSPFRYLERYAKLIVQTFVSSAAINAGSHLVVTQPTGGAGVFIPVGSGVQIIPPAAPPPIH